MAEGLGQEEERAYAGNIYLHRRREGRAGLLTGKIQDCQNQQPINVHALLWLLKQSMYVCALSAMVLIPRSKCHQVLLLVVFARSSCNREPEQFTVDAMKILKQQYGLYITVRGLGKQVLRPPPQPIP